MIGRRLAHYEINEHLGSGGMGDVYRATDTRLERSVALKFLRKDVGSDPVHVARFRREAKALAALNHPHIAAIHGQEVADGHAFLVMEFIPGETLDQRISGRPVPLPEAVRIAGQIIQAIETAHESGIVHRDLKPGNVKITPAGQVKVLDFGLAKLAEGGTGARNGEDVGTASIVTLASTDSGVIIGTPAYMSPEQAKGLPVDRRTDIFAFGCVFFEMLTGRRAFAGTSAADIVSRVLQRDPDWTLIPPHTPPALEHLLRLCLEKDPQQRRQSAGDVRVDLIRALSEPVARAAGTRRIGSGALAMIASLVAVATLAVWALSRERHASGSETRTQIVTPQTQDPMHFAVSPDGAYLVFAAPAATDDVQRLYLRAMNATEPEPLPSTDGATFPFWSPDGRSIGFFAHRKLFRLDIKGGRPQALAPAANPFGGAWGKDGTILFAPTTVSPLFRVSANGGKPIAATKLQSPRQTNHRGPSFLPDGRRFLFYAVATKVADSGEPDEAGVYLGSLDGGMPKRLTAADSAAVYFPPDRIMFVEQGTLKVRTIDSGRGELSGDPATIAEPVGVFGGLGWFSVSGSGMIAYRSGRVAPRRMTWFDRAGNILRISDADLNAPSLSRDKRFIAYDQTVGSNRDVWITDLVRGGATPLTRHPAIDGHPVWSHDGSQIAFESQRLGTFDIWKKSSSGGTDEELVLGGPANEWPLDWSRDGRFLLIQRTDDNYVSSDLIAVPMNGSDRTPIVVADSDFEERMGNFSPDGRWIVYETDESGRPEVVIKPFQQRGGLTRVSTNGGGAPRWSDDGREIYFVAPDGKMMATAVAETGSTLKVGMPTALFATHIAGQTFTFQYAVSRDGQFLVGNRQIEQASAPPITLIQNWKPIH
jgi:serine/threonine protein kinase/Tol biopolymer transport system component